MAREPLSTIRIKIESYKKLIKIAEWDDRTYKNMNEKLIDEAYKKAKKKHEGK